MKWLGAAAAAFALALVLTAPPAGAAQRDSARLDVYTGVVGVDQLGAIRALGIDRHELDISAVRGAKDTVRVETIITGAQAAELRRDGVKLAPKEIDGSTVAERATLMAANGHEVFRKYSGAGGLKEEFEEIAADNRKITKLVSIGETINGEDIVALKISKDARSKRDGRKPSVLYMGAQHAREWITPEMNRRLAHYFVDGYSDDRDIRELVAGQRALDHPGREPGRLRPHLQRGPAAVAQEPARQQRQRSARRR